MILEEVKYQLSSISEPHSDGYLLAVSGGKDSMVLLDLFSKLNVKFIVAHMNYGLRGEASDLDENLVSSVCADFGIEFYSKQVDTKAYCEEHGVATQEGARQLRYNWFNELLLKHNLNWIVTAHHEEDNKETFIQNLKRGSGLRGLKAMKSKHEKRLKPMIGIAKYMIDEHAAENKVEYREDASNNQNHYQRNLIRNKILPQLEKDLEGIGQGISSSIKHLQDDYAYLVLKLNEDASRCLVKMEDGYKVLDFKNIHPRLLFHILERFGFNNQQSEDILNSSSSGKKLFNEEYLAQDSHGDLYIIPNIEEVPFQIELNGLGEYDLDGQKIRISEVAYPSTFTQNKSVAFVDADKLSWPLVVRSYQQGDRIQPIGMSGSKKLSDYFTDEKMPVFLRKRKKIVVSNDETVWLIGELMSDSYKLTDTTKKVLKFETL